MAGGGVGMFYSRKRGRHQVCPDWRLLAEVGVAGGRLLDTEGGSSVVG